jgi:proteic killer suppression protein
MPIPGSSSELPILTGRARKKALAAYTVCMYNVRMILSFGDKATEDIFNGKSSKAALRIPKPLWARIQLKLDSMNASTSLQDLKVPPSNHLEKLTGKLAGMYSIRVNVQYRIVFRFEAGHCHDVECLDYHK